MTIARRLLSLAARMKVRDGHCGFLPGFRRAGALPGGYCVLAACLWTAIFPAAAGDRVSISSYLIENWQTEDGLPQNSVTSIAQTPDGYLWLGTFNGLVRFDGVKFEVFDAVTTPELGSSRVVALRKDSSGALWILSEFGDLSRLQNGRIERLTEEYGRGGNLAGDFRGEVWLQSDSALTRLSDGEEISLSGSELGRVCDMTFDAEGRVWITRKRGVGVSEHDTVRFEPVLPGFESLPEKLAPCRTGGLWVAYAAATLSRYREGKFANAPERIPGAPGRIPAMLEDSRGNLWIGTLSNGLMRRSASGLWEAFNTKNGFSHDSIRDIFEDREGLIWVGTDGGGLNRLNERKFVTRGGAQGVLLSVTEADDGIMWLGYIGAGLRRLEGDPVQPVHWPASLTHQASVWTVLAGRDRVIWTSDNQGGLLRLSNDRCEQISYAGDRPLNYARALLETRSGAVWVGHLSGLLRLEGEDFSVFTTDDGLPSNDVRALAEGEDGALWIGTNGGGLARHENGRFHVRGAENGLIDDRIWSLYHDESGTLWVGTFGRGLSRFKDGVFFNFAEALPVRVVSCILEDDGGFLWIASMKGVFRVEREHLNRFADGKDETLSYRHFDRADGLSTIEFSGGLQPAGWKARDGKLWFASLKGAAVVDPARLPFDSRPPGVVIEQALVDGRPGMGEERLLVPAGTDRVDFRFTALSFAAPEKIRFKYRLEGLDHDWVEAGGTRAATYLHMPPGKYRFRVIACNHDGVWNTAGAALAVVAIPRYWQTWWFRLASAAALAGLGWMGYHVRLRQVESVNRLRLRIAGDLHDEIGANLGSIGLNTDLMMHSGGLNEGQRQELATIGTVTSETIHSLRDIVWFANPNFDNSAGMLRRMKEVAAVMLAGRQWRFAAPDAKSSRPLPLEFRRNVFLIFKEVLHNIIKHSNAPEVEIVAKVDSENFQLSVRDNGCGFDVSQLSAPGLAIGNRDAGAGAEGQGLLNLQKRSSELGGEFSIVSQPGAGTRIELSVPLRRRRRLPRIREGTSSRGPEY